MVVHSDEVARHVAWLFLGAGQAMFQPGKQRPSFRKGRNLLHSPVTDVVADDCASLDQRCQPLNVNLVWRQSLHSEVTYGTWGSLTGGGSLFSGPSTKAQPISYVL